MNMKIIKYVLPFSFILLVTACSTKTYNSSLPAMRNNYSATTENASVPSNYSKKMSEEQIIDTTLKNNPGYNGSKLKSVAAEANYHESLSKLSPTVTSGTSGNTVGYSNLNPATATTDSLKEKSLSNAAKMNVANYKRLLVEKARIENNERNKFMSMYDIAKADEAFQQKMAEKELAKIKRNKNRKLSKADYLNFMTQSLMAKAKAIKAGQNYQIASYDLAATMGRTDAKLSYKNSISQNKVQEQSDKMISKKLTLNHYLNLAIENRPDLQQYKDELKAAKYNLYTATGNLAPKISINNKTTSTNADLFQGGSNITNIRKKDAEFAIENEKLKKKWISIIKEVRTAYVSLKANIAIRNKYFENLQQAKTRRDLINNEYSKGTADVATFNQAQNTYIDTRQNFVKAEKGVADSRAELLASCGIPFERQNKPSIEELNQAQQMYVDTSRDLIGTDIGVSNAAAGLNAAAGIP